MTEYDITAAFKAVEDELIASMIRNMDRHRAEETEEGYEWSMWQAEQLKALEKYKLDNQKKYKKQFLRMNKEIDLLIRQARQTGNMQQEIRILQMIKKGWKVNGKNHTQRPKSMTAEFFRLNDRKLEALIEATLHDMEQAETAILRKANDDYRKAIYNAQVYANTGAGTYEKAVDMVTKDMLSRGLNCIVYANGARHTLPDYADMAIRTASKRAYLQGEGEKRQEWGISTVIMAKRGNPCPKCLPFVGKVLIDDVWSGGPANGKDMDTGKKYPLMSYAISQGLYHPRCKDSHTTYYPGISTADDTWTKEELEAIGQNYAREQKQLYAERQAEKYDRLLKSVLDEENRKLYQRKAEEWKAIYFDAGLRERVSADIISSLDITGEWTKNKGKQGTIIEGRKYTYAGITYEVDGRHVVLRPTSKEKTIAVTLSSQYGKTVEFVPQILYPQGIQTPDYLIDGERFDLKSPTGTGKNLLYGLIAKKKKQSHNFIIDVTECPLSLKELQEQTEELYRSPRVGFLDKIVFIRRGKVEKVYGRKIKESHS